MRQLIQSYRSGEMTIEEVPPPALRPGGVLVRTVKSLVSAGTEKMIVDLARKSLLGKARARPDLVRKVINTAKKQGIMPKKKEYAGNYYGNARPRSHGKRGGQWFRRGNRIVLVGV